MKYLRAIGGAMKWTALAAWVWTACHGAVWALPPRPTPPTEAADTSSAYVLPYSLVILAVALGLLVVLRSSSRREREKPEEYQSKEMLSGD